MNIYLSSEEQKLVSRAARELGTTHAYIVRLALRSMFDLSLGVAGEDELRYLTLRNTDHMNPLAEVDMSKI